MKSTTLYYCEGSSDKVYQASIEPKGAGFVVNFAFGRRGSTLNTGTKTQQPVDKRAAELIFEKLVREKQAKGYTVGEAGTPYTSTEAKEYSGILPQLLNPITEDELKPYIESESWVMQEKLDGKRLLLLKEGEKVRGINRKGLFVGVPETILNDALKIQGSFLLDGECIGDHYHVFDILNHAGHDLRGTPYRARLITVIHEVGLSRYEHIRAVPSFTTNMAKRRFVETAKIIQKEGVVFKNLEAPYTPGRPNSGGSQLKCKFYAAASFIVSATNKQRSVMLSLIKDGKQVIAGNVTVPANQPVPAVGSVVEVRYLYAFQESGSVYQPTLLGGRDDLDVKECTVDQLKFKPIPNDEDADQ